MHRASTGSAVQCRTMQCSAAQCSTVQCNEVQDSAVQCSTAQYTTALCSDVPLAGVMMGSIERCISDVNGLLQMGEEVLLT